MNWEYERKQMIRHGLCVAVDWVEGVRGEGSGDDPFVMRLVDVFVDDGDV